MVTPAFKSSKVGASPVESQAGRVVVRSGRGAGRLKLLRPLALRDGIGEMLGRGFHEVKVWERADRPLADYIRDEHVDVVITFDPGRQSFAVDDPYWGVIETTPEAAGFRSVPVPDHDDVRVYVRRTPSSPTTLRSTHDPRDGRRRHPGGR